MTACYGREGKGGEDGDEDREEGQGRGGTGEKGSSWREREMGKRVCELVDENRYLYRVDEKE